jgi:starch phosphorylase
MSEKKYTTKAAYFSMEIAIDQALKTYSGGLGFLAGSHMRSAYELDQDLVGVTMLWKYGYYDQVRGEDAKLEVKYIQKFYSFLEDTGVTVEIKIHNTPVKVKAYYLAPEIFNTAPIYFLTTDIDENDYLAKTITHHLYDSNINTRIAQEMVLGIGGVQILEKLRKTDVFHMNEAHSLPLSFNLYQKYKDIDEVRKRVVFTTHTPELAGNSNYPYDVLKRMNYFSGVPLDEVKQITGSYSDTLACTPAALRLCKIANGVSQMHAEVAQEMWKDYVEKDHIIGITNSQNQKYWQDKGIRDAMTANDDALLVERKSTLKTKLFKEVANQEGDLFKEDVLTIVWARRFAGYKRPELITREFYSFLELLEDTKFPVQVIWAGKPYPKDKGSVDLFNQLIDITYSMNNCDVLVGYELELSGLLKKGADIWLNTPRITREASGTSGMTASMNGAINLSINDGWIPEYEKDGKNCFLIPSHNEFVHSEEQDQADYVEMMKVLKNKVIPMYYEDKEGWTKMMKNSINDVFPFFESGRMADEYYTRLYDFEYVSSESKLK